MSLLDRVGCGEVVVLARVDDYAGEAVDYARHILIDQRALHVDVAEQNAVQGVVEHHIQTFECAHYGDLGHAEARAVVAQADVAADLFAYFVQSLAHDAEVLLGGERTAESLGRRAVGHVVEQALARGADYGDDVGALSGCGLCLYDIFVDVTRRYDYVEVGARPFADGGDVVFSTLAVGCDFGDAGVDIRFQRRFALGCRTYGRAGDVEFAGSDLLGDLLGRESRFDDRVAEEEQGAFAQYVFLPQLFHHHVRQRYRVGIHAVDADQTAQRPLDGYRRITFHKILHPVGDLARYVPGVFHLVKVYS